MSSRNSGTGDHSKYIHPPLPPTLLPSAIHHITPSEHLSNVCPASPNIISLRFWHSTHSTFPLLLAGSSDGILSSLPITADLFACLDWHVLATPATPSLARRLGAHRVVFGWWTELGRNTPNPLSVFLMHCGITFLCFDHHSLAIHPQTLLLTDLVPSSLKSRMAQHAWTSPTPPPTATTCTCVSAQHRLRIGLF
ncbi:hypothetical protein BLNAU_22809 [Blattamonas nauphoetae]|uniref:Uncharacterized protein n=1 Tax=Blattamonas nauphoetae TaxID=2049346 RepID=A0ABQ9WU81_9EUKA|nr:hypothetical protein BLNAU_22809 [Blattamonas nauphoetae]